MNGPSVAASAALLPVAITLPLAGAALAPVLARAERRLPLIVALLALLSSAGCLLPAAARVYGPHARLLVHYLGHQTPLGGTVLGITLGADPLGMTFALLSALLGALLIVATLSELGDLGPRELAGFSCLAQLLLAALIGSALTADLINLFVWFQVAALASYGLTGFFLERPIAVEAAFKMIGLTSIAGFAVFIGAAMLYSAHGGLSFGQLHASLRSGTTAADALALALLIFGFATKAGLVPAHGWLPDAHTAPPGPVSALFSALMVNLGIISIVRVSLEIFGHGHLELRVTRILLVAGIVSALLAAILALAQDDIKRLLAWDTVSQMGVLTVGFALASPYGAGGATYHLINHALFKSLLFLCAGAVVHNTGKTTLSELGDLWRQRPALAIGFTIGAAAIAGLPPLNGYVSLGMIHKAALDAHDPFLFVGLLVAQVITIAALARATYLAFFRRRDRPYESLDTIRGGTLASLGGLGVGCLAFGVAPGRVIKAVVQPAVGSLLDPDRYASSLLSGTAPIMPRVLPFGYFDAQHLVISGLSLVLGIAVCVWYVRSAEPRWVSFLRRIHTGSINDYAAFATAGLVITATTLLV